MDTIIRKLQQILGLSLPPTPVCEVAWLLLIYTYSERMHDLSKVTSPCTVQAPEAAFPGSWAVPFSVAFWVVASKCWPIERTLILAWNNPKCGNDAFSQQQPGNGLSHSKRLCRGELCPSWVWPRTSALGQLPAGGCTLDLLSDGSSPRFPLKLPASTISTASH